MIEKEEKANKSQIEKLSINKSASIKTQKFFYPNKGA